MCILSVFFCYLSPSVTALMHTACAPIICVFPLMIFWACLVLVGGNMVKKKAWGRTLAWKCEFSSWSRLISGGLPTNQLSILRWHSRDCLSGDAHILCWTLGSIFLLPSEISILDMVLSTIWIFPQRHLKKGIPGYSIFWQCFTSDFIVRRSWREAKGLKHSVN